MLRSNITIPMHHVRYHLTTYHSVIENILQFLHNLTEATSNYLINTECQIQYITLNQTKIRANCRLFCRFSQPGGAEAVLDQSRSMAGCSPTQTHSLCPMPIVVHHLHVKNKAN